MPDEDEGIVYGLVLSDLEEIYLLGYTRACADDGLEPRYVLDLPLKSDMLMDLADWIEEGTRDV